VAGIAAISQVRPASAVNSWACEASRLATLFVAGAARAHRARTWPGRLDNYFPDTSGQGAPGPRLSLSHRRLVNGS
jgi:hypothetical protein